MPRIGLDIRLGSLLILMCLSACKTRDSKLATSGGIGVTRVVFKNATDYLAIEILRDDIIHFETARGQAPSTRQSLYHTPMVTKDDYPGPTRFTERANGFDTARLSANVDATTLCVEVVDTVLKKTLHKSCPARLNEPWKGIVLDSPATRQVYGLGQYFINPGTADGDWVGRIWDPGMETQGNSLRGFSGGANGVTQIPVMYALGDAGHQYAIFLDQAYKLMWNFQSRPWKIDMWGDQIRWYVLGGDTIRDLRRAYMELTGRPPVPPKKALGLFVSEFGYVNWGEVHDRLASLEKNHFPVDGFGMDLQWFGGSFYDRGADVRGSRMGKLAFDPKDFANADQEIAQLRKGHGINLLAIEESYVSKFLPEHDYMAKQNYLVKRCGTDDPSYLDANPWWGVGGMIDWTNPDAGSYWFRTKRLNLVKQGITFHWTDLGEPEMFDPNGCYYGFPALNKHNHGDIHNLYNFQWLESIARGYKDNGLTQRPYMMSRSGAAGMQRFGAGMWSGDIGANMGALTAHFNAQMHMSMAGIDFYGSDVGGFHRRNDTLDGDQDKLFTQWLANSSVFDTPVRSHVWNVNKTLKTNPTEIGHLPSNLFNVRQRYALAPYYYSLAYEAHRQGEPMIPPLVYYFPEDGQVRTMGNQKMVGPWLMAAVVARYDEVARDVYLPAGRWVNFHTNDWHSSTGQTVTNIPAYQDGKFRIPLFARAGAIIPMAYVDGQTANMLGMRRDGSRRDDLIIRVFPDSLASSFTLYEDDGETTAYEQGETAITIIKQSRNANGITIDVAPTTGHYQGMPDSRPFTVEVILDGDTVAQVQLNDADVAPCSSGFDEATRDLKAACWRMADAKRVVVYGGMLAKEARKAVEITVGKGQTGL